MTAREWLLNNGYSDVVDLIDEVIAQCKAKGVRTRRNWWETLAGGRDGRPRMVYGIAFPVLVVAQKHQGRPVTPNAIQRNGEEVPKKIYHGRSLKYAQTLAEQTQEHHSSLPQSNPVKSLSEVSDNHNAAEFEDRPQEVPGLAFKQENEHEKVNEVG